MIKKDSHLSGVIKSLGLVFGDIGTSPTYTISVVFLLTRPTPEYFIGVLSLIVWTLVTLVSLESEKGELMTLDHEVLESLQRHETLSTNVEAEFEKEVTLGRKWLTSWHPSGAVARQN
jgi:hypothetical protein